MLYASSSGSEALRLLDQSLYGWLQQQADANLSTLMIGVTLLGDAAVTVPVVLAALAWMLYRRAWRTASYWALATALGTVWVALVKNLTQVPRPQELYTGLSSYSFPSGHSTMSLVIYGLLAFLISRGWPAGRRWGLMLAAGTLIAAIGISRLYLGAHWLSDVVGGYALGMAWVTLLVMAWRCHRPHSEPLDGLLAVVLAALLLAGSWHVYSNAAAASTRYLQPEALSTAQVMADYR